MTPEANRERAKAWYYANKERAIARVGQYNKDNPDKVKAYNKKWKKENPEKRKAHRLVNNAIRDGKFVKPTACEDCGAEGVTLDMHHEDYSKPFEVDALCRQCHKDRHRYEDVEDEAEI